ncbi:MAG: DJ-1/PfpI family protein [Lentisphaeria bacterium]|nr:DJ-1/PfpI family protein [Lentisphaeria bacterium]
MKKVLLIIADGFEEIEALGTVDVLRRLGIEVTVAGLSSGEKVSGAHQMAVIPDAPLSDVVENSFDAVVLPGGMPGAANLDKSPVVTAVLEKAHRENKVIAAICAAPFILAKRNLLNGKVFTMYPGFESELGGVSYTSNPAETDGKIVTGKGPGAVFEFAKHLAVSLGMAAECEKLYQGMFVE